MPTVESSRAWKQNGKMALDALSSNELLNFIIYDTISAAPYSNLEFSDITVAPDPTEACAAALLFETSHPIDTQGGGSGGGGGGGGACSPSSMTMHCPGGTKLNARKAILGTQGRKKRRRRPRVCKNKEETENQRMTHIAVERNRRKQMNEHLAVLRSLMPESYIQRVIIVQIKIHDLSVRPQFPVIYFPGKPGKVRCVPNYA